MRGRSTLIALLAAVMLAGCAGGAGTTVILLPDADGKVGRVTVTSGADARSLDRAYDSASAGRKGFGTPPPATPDKVAADYAELLAAEPAKPAAYMLYFQSGTADLVSQSVAQLAEVVEQIRSRLPTEVTVIGHTDTRGSDVINDKLSLQRARAVEKMLRERVPQLGMVTVRSFGAKEPLVPTAPNVDEPRNRRVEIFIL